MRVFVFHTPALDPSPVDLTKAALPERCTSFHGFKVQGDWLGKQIEQLKQCSFLPVNGFPLSSADSKMTARIERN